MVNDFQTDVTIHVFFIKYHREMIADTVFNNDGCFYGWNWKEIASSAHRYNFLYTNQVRSNHCDKVIVRVTL